MLFRSNKVGHTYTAPVKGGSVQLTIAKAFSPVGGSVCKIYSFTNTDGKKNLVVAYRGSQTSDDWENNLDLDQKQAILGPNSKMCGNVHSGFLNSYEKSRIGVHGEIRDLIAAGNVDKVLSVGHSQGGSVAQLFAVEFALTHPNTKQVLVTFGQPLTVTSQFATVANEHVKDYTRFVTTYITTSKDSKGNVKTKVNEDLIANIPPSFFGFVHTGTKQTIMCPLTSFMECHDSSEYVKAVQKQYL